MKKIWLVTQESMVDGEVCFTSNPCASMKAAKRVMDEIIECIMTETHFANKDSDSEDFDIEQDDTTYHITDLCDDYYEYVDIEELDIIQ